MPWATPFYGFICLNPNQLQLRLRSEAFCTLVCRKTTSRPTVVLSFFQHFNNSAYGSHYLAMVNFPLLSPRRLPLAFKTVVYGLVLLQKTSEALLARHQAFPCLEWLAHVQ